MKRQKKWEIVIYILTILVMSLIINMMRDNSLAVNESSDSVLGNNDELKPGVYDESSDSVSGGNDELKPGSYLEPYPVLTGYNINSLDSIVSIPKSLNVRNFLGNIKIKLYDDATEREWKLIELEQKSNESMPDLEGKVATYVAYVPEADANIGFWIINKNGKVLGELDKIGTGTRIMWVSGALGGEFEVSGLALCSIKGDLTGDGISNIYDITDCITKVYDTPEDYEWDNAEKTAANVVGEENQKPNIYDIQQMVEDNFDN